MRILLIAYYFPPFNSVGAIRPAKFAEYLHHNGHEVYVLAGKNQPYPQGLQSNFPRSKVTYCSEWSVNTPVELVLGGRRRVARQGFISESSSSFKSTLGWLYKTLFHWPDAQLGWVQNAVSAGMKLLERDKFDLIYVSAAPFSGLRVASMLSRASGVPWVAEFRDLWTDNHGYKYPKWRKWLERKWEAKLLSTASALVSVSSPLVEKLRQRYDLPVWEIRNGFDPEDYDGTEKPDNFILHGLNIVFTGNIYPDHYELESFCRGLAGFRDKGGSACVHVAGRNVAALLNEAKKLNLEDMFIFQSTVERAVALAMQKHADVLLTFLWDGGRQAGIYSTKLFEYAGAQRPILAVGMPKSDIGLLLDEWQIGKACATSEEITLHLLLARDFKKESGELRTKPITGLDFTRRTQFMILEKKLAELLEEV